MNTPQPLHLEASLEHDLAAIRAKLQAMEELDEQALRSSLQAVLSLDRQLAYTVILRDRRVDELETELDRLCLEFLVRYQPAAGILRFVYSTSKIIKELERIGDYAESVARQALQLNTLPQGIPRDKFEQMANLVIPMVRNAVRAFLEKDADLARATMVGEDQADALRNQINQELTRLLGPVSPTLTELAPLLAVARRFERAADQAYNICEEALYYATGEYQKHRPMESFHVVFIGESNTCLSVMAEAIARSLGQERFRFTSAGLVAGQLNPQMIEFMRSKGMDVSGHTPRSVDEIGDLDQAQVVIGLCREARKLFPSAPTKTVGLEWHVVDPAKVTGDAETVRAAYETAFDFLQTHIRHLTQAILGERDEVQ